MKVIFPFTYFDEFLAQRYREQLEAIADNVECLNLIINEGTKTSLDHKNIECHYDQLVNPHQQEKEKTLKDTLETYSGFAYWGKTSYIPRLIKKFTDVDGDIVLGMSGAGWQQVFHNLLGRRKGIPVVYRMRGNGRYERKLNNNNLVNRVFNDNLENISYLMYSHFIPINSAFRQLLIERGVAEHKISDPVGLGVDTGMFSPSKRGGEYVGYFGMIAKKKGGDLLLNLIKKTPTIKYLIAGANGMGITFPPNVVYEGRVRKSMMPGLINRCKYIILPSRSEGLSNCILEAYACGKVVLGSKHAFADSLPRYLPELDLDLDQWVQEIRDMEGRSFYSLSKQARLWALEHSWKKFGIKMTNELKKVVEHTRKNEERVHQ